MHDDSYYTFWRKHWITAFYVGALLITLVSVWLWFNCLQTNPERAFWNAVSQNLETSSVTVSTLQTSGDNTLKQSVALGLGANNTAHALVHVKRGGTKITTEVIGTPEADYTRYTSIEGGSVKAKGVTDVWAKSEPQLFGQSALGIGLSLGSVPVPIANVHGSARVKLLREIKNRNLYRVDFSTVKKKSVDGRLLYTYQVTSAPFVYVQVLELTAHQIGVRSLEKIDPADYKDLKNITMRMTVDVRARHITDVTYDNPNGSDYTQTYSAYDVPVAAPVPQQSIPMAELQQRLQASGNNKPL